MATLIKTIGFSFLFILPWALMKVHNWDTGFQDSILRNPLVVISILLPGALLNIWWLATKSK